MFGFLTQIVNLRSSEEMANETAEYVYHTLLDQTVLDGLSEKLKQDRLPQMEKANKMAIQRAKASQSWNF